MTVFKGYRVKRAVRTGVFARTNLPTWRTELERHARAGVHRQRGVSVRISQLSRGEDQRTGTPAEADAVQSHRGCDNRQWGITTNSEPILL